MRHTFVIHLAADSGTFDPQDLMGDLEEVVAEAIDIQIAAGGSPLRDVDVECIDAYPTSGVLLADGGPG